MKICIDCGDLADGTRCPACQLERDRRVGQQRGGAYARGYGKAWQRTSARVRRLQPACAVCGSTTDLTVDHIVSKAHGGSDNIGTLQTLCRSHNGAKGSPQV